MKFKQDPDYKWMKQRIKDSIIALEIADPKYDWELLEKSKVETISLIDLTFTYEYADEVDEETSTISSTKTDSHVARGGCANCCIA